MVSKFWRYILERWGLWLCDSSDKIGSKKLNMAGIWPGVTKKLLMWKTKQKNILFHSKVFLSTFLRICKFLDITSAELLSLQSIWYRSFKLCLMSSTHSHVHNYSYDTYGQHEAGDWIYHTYNFVERLQCEFSCIVGKGKR